MFCDFVPEVFAPKSQDLQRALVLHDGLTYRLYDIRAFLGDRTGGIKWDPFDGDQTMQMYGDFEGFPLV